MNLRLEIIKFVKEIGFDLIGFSQAKINPRYIKAYKNWIKNSRHADMKYLEKMDRRFNMEKFLPSRLPPQAGCLANSVTRHGRGTPSAKSVIVLATNYYHHQPELKHGHGRIARYAYGRDYHKIIGKKLKQIENFIKKLEPSARTKSYVDTGPLMERALAEQSGIGRIGKNGCLITKEFGSWIFLSEIITTIDLAGDETRNKKSLTAIRPFSVCGTCNRCVSACPTGAIIAPGIIDANLCVSYLTIEKKGEIPPKLLKKIKKTKRIFGCDICQEICPHNLGKQKTTTQAHCGGSVLAFSRELRLGGANSIHEEFLQKIAGNEQNIKKLLSIKNEQEFLNLFAGSPLMRAKLKGMKRNLK